MTEQEKTYHHGDLKAALVQAGLDILETQGLPGLSLRAIAARVGVSHTAPKNHFGSLRGLLTAIGAEGFRRNSAFMRREIGPTADRQAKLTAALLGYVHFAKVHPHLFELMFSPLYCDYEDPALLEAAQASYAILSEISARLDWDKGIGPGAQRRTEMMLWSLVHGYAKLTLSGQFAGTNPGEPDYDITEIVPSFRYLPEA